jgi:inosose dehydratase
MPHRKDAVFALSIGLGLWYDPRGSQAAQYMLKTVRNKKTAVMKQVQGRREFLTAGVAASAAALVAGCSSTSPADSEPASRKPTFELGLASYTFRKFDLDKTLQMTKRVGLTHICLKDIHLPLDSSSEQIAQVVAKVKDAGLDLAGGGLINMKTEQEVSRAFDYARAAGMRVIVATPNHELLPLVNRKVQEYDIKVAIHNHGPTDKLYPVPASVYERIQDLDERVGLCDDIGHTTRAGMDVATSLQKYSDRLLEVHMKDVSAATDQGRPIEVGRGVIDIPRVLRALIKIDYTGIVSFEYEKDENDPLPGLAESVGFVRGALRTLSS